jgi:hypothetical protein
MVEVCRRSGVATARCDQMQERIEQLAASLGRERKDKPQRWTGRLNC